MPVLRVLFLGLEFRVSLWWAGVKAPRLSPFGFSQDPFTARGIREPTSYLDYVCDWGLGDWGKYLHTSRDRDLTLYPG